MFQRDVSIIPMFCCCRFFCTVCFDGPCALSSEDYFPCLWRFYLSIQHHSSCLRFPISRVCKSVHFHVSICVSIKLSSEPSGKLTQQCDYCLQLWVELTRFKTCNFIVAFVIFTYFSTSRVCFPNGIDFLSPFDYWYMLIYKICYQYKDKIDFTRMFNCTLCSVCRVFTQKSSIGLSWLRGFCARWVWVRVTYTMYYFSSKYMLIEIAHWKVLVCFTIEKVYWHVNFGNELVFTSLAMCLV